jgi:aminoglycoside phosphotransferase (APT) family kinase protein
VSAGPCAVDATFAERIARAAAQTFGSCTVSDLRVMAGGHSGLTHVAELETPVGRVSAVVRATPPGRRPVGRHDVLRQARIMAALGHNSDVPVPAVLFTDADDPPFFVTELVAGVAIDPILGEPEPGETKELIATRWKVAIELLARLHATPLARLGIVGEEPREPGEEVDVWARTMRAAGMEDDDRASRLQAALRATAPRRRVTALVHGDYRLGNILMQGAAPRALIDWEIWSVGDPAVDLGWLVQFTDAGTYPGLGREVPGTPTADDVVARYAEAAGRDARGLDWFLALGCFKLAAIQAHNRRRHLDGQYHDEFQELLGPSIERLLERGLAIAT